MISIKNKLRCFLCLIAVAFIFSACTKNFEKINETQGAPTVATIGSTMNSIFSSLFLQWQEQASIHNDYYYEATQLGAETSVSGYVLANGVHDIWQDYYSQLQNMRKIQDQINAANDQESMKNIQSILYIMKAYKTFRMTDQFGDIPYFNAGKAYSENPSYYRVAYDPQQLIYDSLLNDLTWAVKNINTSNNPVSALGDSYASLGNFDVLFNGNMTQWLKFANSLRLRYAMQMVEKDPSTATAIIQDAITGSAPLIDAGNDVGMWPASLGNYDLSSRWWSFSSGGTGFVRMSSTMWNMVSDNTTTAGIFDPRAYLFVTTNQAGKWAPYTIGVSSGDAVNAYFSASDPTQKNNCEYSPFNWYLVRDEWYIPELIMTEAEVHFLKAEAYARGLGVAQSLTTANTEYQAGIASSVDFWYKIAANTDNKSENWSTAAPPAPTQTEMNALFANPKVKFTGTTDDALTKIYAQEWLSFFREPWLAFNLWRRTGKTPMDPASKPSSTLATFYRLPYAQDEAVNNSDNYNAEISKIGGNNTNVKVWWMP